MATWPAPQHETGRAIRALIYRVAAEADRIGPLCETLKWGQPAWHPAKAGIGTTLRLGPARKSDPRLALMVPCQTTLVSEMQMIHPEGLAFDGNRGLFLPPDAAHDPRVRDFIRAALGYYLRD